MTVDNAHTLSRGAEKTLLFATRFLVDLVFFEMELSRVPGSEANLYLGIVLHHLLNTLKIHAMRPSAPMGSQNSANENCH